MKREIQDKRTSNRVATEFSSILAGNPPAHLRIINFSEGGVCIEFSAPPPASPQGLALQFHYAGHDLVVHSKIVWVRPYRTTSDREEPALDDGWVAGFKFAEGERGSLINDVPDDILRSGDIRVSLLADIDAAEHSQNEIESEGNRGLITFSEHSILGVKEAAKELLPVFAKHFTDVHMIFTRDRLEISAPFRHPDASNLPEARPRDYRTIEASQAANPPAPVRIEQPAALVQPKSTSVMHGRRRGLIAVVSLAAVVLGWSLLGVSHKSGGIPVAPKVSVEGRSIPAWAAGIDQTSLDGWIEVQKKFDLPDATVRSAIQILRTNDKYGPGQDLHDLARYPTEVKRAFSLLAGAQTGTPFNFDPLMDDLKGRSVSGLRFPDEPPGGSYSLLERERFNNVAVLAAIELFHRRQDDPSVKAILAALQRRQR